jgi:electron transport complex protein RnfC
VATAFGGGVRLKDRGGPASGKAVVGVPVPSRVIIHLSQHAGTPALPLVKPGDPVKIGTKIAEADGLVSAPVHASVSGRVRSIVDHPHPAGSSGAAIEIESDGRQQWVDLTGWRDLTSADPETVLGGVKQAGVVGLGGAAFPSHVKLAAARAAGVDTVILNGAECEPYLAADHRIMVENAAGVAEGLRVLVRILDARAGIIAVGRDKPDAVSCLRQAVKDDAGLGVKELRGRYPQGAEKLLVKTITGKEVPSGGLPTDVGCLVHNVGTSVAIHEAVKFGRPLVNRVVTVVGAAGGGNFRVPIGTPASHLVGFAGGEAGSGQALVLGGPMTGAFRATADVPIVKGTTGVILLPVGGGREPEPGPCIRCGRCVDCCPMGLMPNQIVRFVEKGRIDLAGEYGLADCIECGVCAYVCPSKIRHVYILRRGKAAAGVERETGR